MGTLICIALIGFCIVLVYNLAEGSRGKYGFTFMGSKPLELLSAVLVGLILTAVIIFFFRFIFIPLVIIVGLYLIAAKYNR